VTATITVGNLPVGVGVGPDAINALTARTNALVAAGALTQNQADALLGKLDQISTKIEAGQINAAINQIGAFINQVSAFIKNGSLTQAQAQPLINGAIALQVSLTDPALAPPPPPAG